MEERKKIWIARNNDCDEETYYNMNNGHGPFNLGTLHLFYDKPGRMKNGKWIDAREIATIPTYMFPEISDGEVSYFIEQMTPEQLVQKYKELSEQFTKTSDDSSCSLSSYEKVAKAVDDVEFDKMTDEELQNYSNLCYNEYLDAERTLRNRGK